MTILVFGASGQIASELARLTSLRGLALACAGRAACDLAEPGAASALIAQRRPSAIINAAAYTAVDKAEADEALAARVNADAAAEIAAAAAARGVPLVHYSTDYVFDGAKDAPYVETDPIAPLGVYGRTKANGEAKVLASGARAAIIRTSWVYSAYGANFVKTMLRLAGEREEVSVVADQRGGPTWARDAAEAGLTLAGALSAGNAAAQGVFHFSSADHTNWAEFAGAVFEDLRRRGRPAPAVRAITTPEYPTVARRPMNSRLDCSKIAALGFASPSPWRARLAACLGEMREQEAI